MSCYQEKDGGIYLRIKAQPRASKNAVGELLGDELKISLTAPPVDDAANEALISFLAEQLGVSRRDVSLVKGRSSRHKVVFIRGGSPAHIEKLRASSV